MLSFLYVYSDHSILECCNLFSGVELSMRSFFVISGELSGDTLFEKATSFCRILKPFFFRVWHRHIFSLYKVIPTVVYGHFYAPIVLHVGLTEEAGR